MLNLQNNGLVLNFNMTEIVQNFTIFVLNMTVFALSMKLYVTLKMALFKKNYMSCLKVYIIFQK